MTTRDHNFIPSLWYTETCKICHRSIQHHGPLWSRVLHKLGEWLVVGVIIAGLGFFMLVAAGVLS